MFLDNRYTKLYYQLIENARGRVLPENTYVEKHHVIPRSLGGNDDPVNLVELTYAEHSFCHKLLVHMTTGINKGKMSFASMLMNKHVYATTKNAQREYIRHLHLGKIPITNGIIDKTLFKDQEMPEGWWPGFSQKTLANKLGKNKGKVYITDGLVIRALRKNETIPEGWRQGYPDWLLEKSRIAHGGEKNGMYHRKFITDGVNNATIRTDEQIPTGWKLGKSERHGEKKSQSKLGNKNPMFGKVPANGISVVINGVVYKSMTEARKLTGMTRTAIEKIVRGSNVRNNQ